MIYFIYLEVWCLVFYIWVFFLLLLQISVTDLQFDSVCQITFCTISVLLNTFVPVFCYRILSILVNVLCTFKRMYILMFFCFLIDL